MQVRSEQYRWVILGTLFSLHVLTAIGQFTLPPLLPFIKKELGLNYTQVGLLTSSFYLGVALTATFAGWTADVLGIKRTIVLGTLTMTVSMLIASAMRSLWGITAVLILTGVGYSVVAPCTNKATMYWFHERLRATAMGIKHSGISGGGLLAGFIIPPVALSLNWHYGFLVACLSAFTGGLASCIFYREPDSGNRPQTNIRKPGIPLTKIILNRNILLLSFDGLCRVGIQNAFLAYLMLYLQKIFQLPIITAGFFFALAQASGAVGRVTWGIISDRIFGGRRKRVYILIALITAALFLVSTQLTSNTPIWVVVLLIAFLGFTAVGSQGVGLTFIAEVVGKEVTGTASGFTQAFTFLGVVLTAPFFGLIVDTFGSYSYAWIALSLLALIASILVAFVKEGGHKTG